MPIRHVPLALAACCASLTLFAQGPITATLVANDAISANFTNTATGATGQQTAPAGPLTAASVSVGYASYTCSQIPSGQGQHLSASTVCTSGPLSLQAATHADLTLTLAAAGGKGAAIVLDIAHLGDTPYFSAFRIDFGDDGSFEVDTGCGICTGLQVHRVWTWDFAQGPLAIRILTDQGLSVSPQTYTLGLDVQPWASGAVPIAADCGGVAAVRNPFASEYETTNYQLRAVPPTTVNTLATLRANGLGTFGAFLVADLPIASPLTLPAPFTMTCDVLGSVLFLDLGAPTANTSFVPPVPRQWDLVVPLLPPGITFFVQHASALPYFPFPFGSSNVLRFDT